MSLITPYQLNRSDLTQDQVDDLVNELLLTEIDFSAKCSLFQRFFGVITGGKEGEQTFVTDLSSINASGHPDKFLLNPCARFAYPRIAEAIGKEIEETMGYTLTPRYVTEEVPFESFDWPSRDRRGFPNVQLGIGKGNGAPFLAPNWRFKTLLPGVEAMGVIPVWGDVEGYEEVDVSPFIQSNLTATLAGDGITPLLRIDDMLAPNPNDVILRKASNNAFVPTFTNDSYPITRDYGSYWEIPLDKNTSDFNVSTDRVNVQHRKYVIVDIVPPDLEIGQEFWPVYPGTHQKILQAKPVEVLESGNWRYTFYIYTLVHPEFVAESVNLVAGEYYKLYPFISFKTLEEEAVLPSLVITRGTQVEILEPTLTLVDQQYGIFHLNYDTCASNPVYQCLCQDWPETIRLRYSYKTNPSVLPLKFQQQITALREAVSARVAAELPTDDCGCPVPFGYINEMQFVFSDQYIDTQSRMAVEKLRYGTLRGQLIYTKTVTNSLPFKRPVMPHLRS